MADNQLTHDEAVARQLASTTKMLNYVKRTHGTGFSIVRQFAGGYQGGAWLIADAAGTQRVFKWSKRKQLAGRVLGAQHVVEQARGKGYPTPRWHFAGISPSGFAYHLQDLAPGSPFEGPWTRDMARSALDVVQLGAGVCPDTEQDLFSVDHARIFEDGAKFTEPLRDHSGTAAAAVDRLESLVAPFKDMAFITSDFVHGDFHAHNILWEDGKVAAVVDAEGVGKGSRFRDVARLATFCAVHGYEEEVLKASNEYAKEHARPGEWEVSLTAQMYENLFVKCVRYDASCDGVLESLDILLKSF